MSDTNDDVWWSVYAQGIELAESAEVNEAIQRTALSMIGMGVYLIAGRHFGIGTSGFGAHEVVAAEVRAHDDRLGDLYDMLDYFRRASDLDAKFQAPPALVRGALASSRIILEGLGFRPGIVVGRSPDGAVTVINRPSGDDT